MRTARYLVGLGWQCLCYGRNARRPTIVVLAVLGPPVVVGALIVKAAAPFALYPFL